MSNTLIGLGDVLNDLINLHNSNRLPNKLLLSGTQGIGKGVLSKVLVQGKNLIIGISGEADEGIDSEGNLITLRSKAEGGSGKVQLEGWKEN